MDEHKNALSPVEGSEGLDQILRGNQSAENYSTWMVEP